VPILHRSLTTNPSVVSAGITPDSPFVRGSAPTLELDTTDYGFRYFGVRGLGDDQVYVRGYHYVMPFHQLRPQQIGNRGLDDPNNPQVIAGHMWVPMDDDNTMVWNMMHSFGEAGISDEARLERGNGNGPDFVDAGNEFRSRAGRWNNWSIDRGRQKTENFSGILGINQQDRAVQESMGHIVDRSREHLGPADRAIITMRQLLLDAVRSVREGGDPPGVGDSYYQVRAIEKILPRSGDWRDAILPEMYPADPGARVPATV
jgi:phthalate 4,5-dioxygenase